MAILLKYEYAIKFSVYEMEKYMKNDFWILIFTDEYQATLDGLVGLYRAQIFHGNSWLTWLRRQHKWGGVMFSSTILSSKIVGSFKIDDGFKINVEKNQGCRFMFW